MVITPQVTPARPQAARRVMHFTMLAAVAPAAIIRQVKAALPRLTVPAMRFLTVAALAQAGFIHPVMVVFLIKATRINS